MMRTVWPHRSKHVPQEMKEHEFEDEKHRLLLYWDNCARWVTRICFSFVILVVATQCLLLIGGFRHYLCPVERLEGILYKYVS
ncbi:hypothetical protein M3650_22685 [Paenibacillus sp. MER TA 81-3]|nr:hypothetical protein [Paenibacillus sp. MER TA 81-3]